jgi:hypothetical protein
MCRNASGNSASTDRLSSSPFYASSGDGRELQSRSGDERARLVVADLDLARVAEREALREVARLLERRESLLDEAVVDDAVWWHAPPPYPQSRCPYRELERRLRLEMRGVGSSKRMGGQKRRCTPGRESTRAEKSRFCRRFLRFRP